MTPIDAAAKAICNEWYDWQVAGPATRQVYQIAARAAFVAAMKSAIRA